MTRDELLALIGAIFSEEPRAVQGGFVLRHMPHVGEFAFLGRIYDPVGPALAGLWSTKANAVDHPYMSIMSEVANGLRMANLSLFGIVERVDRSVGPRAGQPISVDYGNVVEKPKGLDAKDLVIGGAVGWSSKGYYVMSRNGAVRLTHHANAGDIADEWPSLEPMLRAELARIAGLHDRQGRELATATNLMHPNGRRWESKVEPGSSYH